jgi:hypothetical protein
MFFEGFVGVSDMKTLNYSAVGVFHGISALYCVVIMARAHVLISPVK